MNQPIQEQLKNYHFVTTAWGIAADNYCRHGIFVKPSFTNSRDLECTLANSGGVLNAARKRAQSRQVPFVYAEHILGGDGVKMLIAKRAFTRTLVAPLLLTAHEITSEVGRFELDRYQAILRQTSDEWRFFFTRSAWENFMTQKDQWDAWKNIARRVA